MLQTELTAEKPTPSRFRQHRFILLIGATIAISLFLVSVALALYGSSGTAQLDLSRPGYVSVREQVVRSEFDSFSATGTLDEKVLEEFRTLYDKQAQQATSVDSFGGDVMSDHILSLDSPS